MRLPQIVALLCDVLVEKDADAMSSALKCLETLVAWAPLKGYVTRDLLRTLVQLIDEDLRTKTFCGDAAARALSMDRAEVIKQLANPDPLAQKELVARLDLDEVEKILNENS